MNFYDEVVAEGAQVRELIGDVPSHPTVVEITDVMRMIEAGQNPPLIPKVRAPWESAFYAFKYRRQGAVRQAGIDIVESYGNPDTIRGAYDWIESGTHGNHQMGRYDTESNPFKKLNLKRYALGVVYYRAPGERIKVLMNFVYTLTPDGYLEDDSVLARVTREHFEEMPTNSQRFAFLAPAFFAQHLLNCKNVSTEDHPVPPKVAANRVRKGKPPGTTFKTLVVKVPGTKQHVRLYTPGAAKANVETTVRGHFKTYTAERPLLGRYSGEFFFPEHARGVGAAHKIVKDYRVKGAP